MYFENCFTIYFWCCKLLYQITIPHFSTRHFCSYFVWPRATLIGQFPLRRLQMATFKLCNCITKLMSKRWLKLQLFKGAGSDDCIVKYRCNWRSKFETLVILQKKGRLDADVASSLCSGNSLYVGEIWYVYSVYSYPQIPRIYLTSNSKRPLCFFDLKIVKKFLMRFSHCWTEDLWHTKTSSILLQPHSQSATCKARFQI